VVEKARELLVGDAFDQEMERIIRDGLLNEVSVLSPATKPAEPLAKVVLLRERAIDPAGGEVFYGGPVLRRCFETPIVIR
jgi:hypothetical protein